MKSLAIATLLTCLHTASANFQYSSEVQKSRYFTDLETLESLILTRCLPAKTLDFLGTSYVVTPLLPTPEKKPDSYTIHYDLIFPEKTIPEALVVESSLSTGSESTSIKLNVIVDRYSLCR